MRRKIIAGNWKMNKTPSEAVALVNELKDLVKNITSGIDSDKSSTIFKDKLYNDDTKIEERNFDISVGNVEGNTRRQESALSKDTKVSQRTMEFNISELENKIYQGRNYPKSLVNICG